MIIGICDDVKEELEKARTCIINYASIKQKDQIKMFYPEEIMIDIENGVFDCDIMIMDIDFMEEQYNGIYLGNLINEAAPMCQIIYLTHILDFAPDVYETQHCYFVLKNNMQVMLPQAMKKANKIYEEERKHKFIRIICNSHPTFIQVKDIIYIEKEDRKTKVVTTGKEYSCYNTLSSIKKDLPSGFVRCHGSFIIHMDYVTYMGSEEVELNEIYKIPIGRTYAEKVKTAYLSFWSDRA